MKICGIDEAGRGCLAGDLCMAGVVLDKEIDGLKDSKKISEKKRVVLFNEICKNAKFKIVTFTSQDVDKIGLSECLKNGLLEILNYFGDEFEYIYDGNTNFKVQKIKTMIKADALIKEVSAASILAKVTRDENLKTANKKYPEYGFLKHKGYATKAHIEAILKYGYTNFHRLTYEVKALKNVSKNKF
ncbi:ribonuclease HII [Campylobacter ureolyticus]|uniref:Ribonuclease n=1 Tax=Campylobacter ureolyticus TaxID=827 RepID=A0AAE7E8L5_9BACT|nr:ribonuclease HII [Campylobacter ureolyticus]MCR8684749.1 ribonuclease HII [Campylobacter ureolyticus]QKF83630.1 ribonuclease HII [Campylobacter ureolyticus]QQY36212.1 ribonuclease HII [Campylobacter ureolyticus]SUX25120.1 ribonuclease HII [Campylobacter ureolyticus]